MHSRLIKTPVIFFLIGVFYGSAICNENAAQSPVSPGVIFELLALNRDLPTAAKPKYLSPSVLVPSPDSQTLYVGEQTAKQIAVVDLKTNTITKKILFPNDVTGIAVSPDGSKLYATCSSDLWPFGMVCIVDPASGKIENRISVGHTALSPVMSPDGKTLYVCNQFDNNISVIDVVSKKEMPDRITVVREPYSAGITPDGRVLVVANSLPNQRSTDTVSVACQITLINTDTKQIIKSIPLPKGSHSVFGLAVSHDGKYAFATHLVGQFNLIADEIRQGWIHSNNFAIIDIVNQKLLNDVELDLSTVGLANPWGIGCTEDGKFLCITHAGSNELSIIDLPSVLTKINAVDTSLSHAFGFLYTNNLRKRVPVVGKAPRALAIIGTKAYTAGYFGDTVEVFDIGLNTSTSSGKIALGPSVPLTNERMGEYRFGDASLCLQQWQSCMSCHPFGRPDALNWILSDKSGTGAPKNAKSMLYAWWTPPNKWNGLRPGGYESVRSGIELELKLSPSAYENEATSIDTFIMRLKPVLSPYLEKGKLSEAAARGKAIYFGNKVDCKACHPAPLFTNKSVESSPTYDPFDQNTYWDTPSLIEAWRTGPYGHVGHYLTIEEILKVPGHTNIKQLSPDELNDLVKYVESL